MSLNLITKEQFVGYYTIDFSDIADDFSDYADQTEQMVLSDLFGIAMYNDMLANPTDAKYTDLINNYSLSDMCRDFFYFYYLRDRQSYSSTLGEFESEAQNAIRSVNSRNKKVTDAFNRGVKLYVAASEYVSDNKDTYDLYTETEPIYMTNVWGIHPSYPGSVLYPDDWFIRGFPV